MKNGSIFVLTTLFINGVLFYKILIPDGKDILFHRTASLISTHSLCGSAVVKKEMYYGCTSDLRHYYSTPVERD